MDSVEDDFSLKHGDTLNIPTQPHSVTVIGEVNYSTSHLYKQSIDLDQYIASSGGAKKNADLEQIYIIKASGLVVTAKNISSSFFRNNNQGLQFLPEIPS